MHRRPTFMIDTGICEQTRLFSAKNPCIESRAKLGDWVQTGLQRWNLSPTEALWIFMLSVIRERKQNQDSMYVLAIWEYTQKTDSEHCLHVNHVNHEVYDVQHVILTKLLHISRINVQFLVIIKWIMCIYLSVSNTPKLRIFIEALSWFNRKYNVATSIILFFL